MNKQQILTKLKELKPLYEKDGFIIKGIFGSVARDEQNENSDIDILYQNSKQIGYDEFLEIENLLETELNRKVDLVNIKYINPLIYKTAKKDIIYV
ncbi:MAG: nucleotidyltransferase domain-containing protein [Campylobacterales bacterium]|nr:nucleotidyltransferase domain-containing protein [Campylobacterales bacterium]